VFVPNFSLTTDRQEPDFLDRACEMEYVEVEDFWWR